MLKTKTEALPFHLFGQLLDFVIKDGYKLKCLRLVVEGKEYWVKLPKEIRQSLDPAIRPGCFLEVEGISKRSSKTGQLKLKAETVRLVPALNASGEKQAEQAKARQGKILVCKKSKCQKKGGGKIGQALEEKLRDRGLEEEVCVQSMGCIKQCEQGPNLIVMPDKVAYNRLKIEEIPQLIEKHFVQ